MSNQPSFSEFFRYWLRLGFINFGGPAGQIALMHKDLVAARGWVEERVFLRALNFCMVLPGPEAHQLAVYLGWRMFGYRGGAVAGLLFLLPAVFLLLFLSWLAAAHGEVPLVAGVFRGIAGAVVAIVAQALWRMGRKSLRHPLFYGFAAASFLMGYALKLKFPGIVVAAGLMGLWLGAVRPDLFCPGGACQDEEPMPPQQGDASPWRRVGRVTAAFVGIWLAVALPVYLLAEPGSLLPKLLTFYTRASFVTFGGAYAVLAYVSDMSLRLGWLTQEQLVLGLGLAETTPGPLIMVTQFTGFLTAWNSPGALSPLTAGILGGLLTTFGMFLPSFFLVLAGAPHIESIAGHPRVRAALTGITAAIVGVILKLGVIFATATFWPGGLAGGLDVFPLVLAGLCGLALWRWDLGAQYLVLGCGLLGALRVLI